MERRFLELRMCQMPIIYDDGVVISQIFCGTDNNNAYLVICPTTKEAIVVDAPEGVGALLSEDEEVRVQSIIITHKHKDHTEGIDEILQLMGVPVFGHQDDASDIPGSPILTIKDTDTIKVGMLDITVIHTPGHTPGSPYGASGGYGPNNGDCSPAWALCDRRLRPSRLCRIQRTEGRVFRRCRLFQPAPSENTQRLRRWRRAYHK